MQLPPEALSMGQQFWTLVIVLCLIFALTMKWLIDEWMPVLMALPVMFTAALLSNAYLLELFDSSIAASAIDGVILATLAGAVPSALLVLFAYRRLTG